MACREVQGDEEIPNGQVLIKELNKAHSDDGSEDSEGADIHMQAAESRYQEVQTVSTVLVSRGFKTMVSNVVRLYSRFQITHSQALRSSICKVASDLL